MMRLPQARTMVGGGERGARQGKLLSTCSLVPHFLATHIITAAEHASHRKSNNCSTPVPNSSHLDMLVFGPHGASFVDVLSFRMIRSRSRCRCVANCISI